MFIEFGLLKTLFYALSQVKHFQISRHLEMPAEVPLLPFTLKCLPFTLKSSGTSTYEITCINVCTQLKHASFCICASILWMCMRPSSLYVCASVYRCICMEVYMYVRVFIGVYAWKFICMCEYV